MIDINSLSFIGENLSRPECVLVDFKRAVHFADWRGGVSIISNKNKNRTLISQGNTEL